MFTRTDQLLQKGGFEERYDFLKQLREEFNTSKSKDAKQQVIANLANFSYDPLNYELFKRLRIVDLFLEQLSAENEDYLRYGLAGLANLSADSEFVEYLIANNAVKLIQPYLDHRDEEIIINTLLLFIYLITPETNHLITSPEIITKIVALQFEDLRIKNLKSIFLKDYCTADQLQHASNF